MMCKQNLPTRREVRQSAGRHDLTCQRFAFLSGSTTSGFGHMTSSVILGYKYALEQNATIVIDRSKFLNRGRHGAYPWAIDLLGLDTLQDVNQLPTSHLTVVDEAVWLNHFSVEPVCGVMYRSCERCCSTLNRSNMLQVDWCFGNTQRVFQVARPFFLQRFRYPRLNVSNSLIDCRLSGRIDVVWHVRVGDFQVPHATKKILIDRVMNQTSELFGDLKLNLYVLSEGNLSQHGFTDHFKPYKPFYLDALSVEEAFGTMVDASVLITSGSSFAAVAAFYKREPKIALQIKPKEGNKGVYDVLDHAIIDDFGIITHPPLSKLRDRVQLLRAWLKHPVVDVTV